MKRVQQLMGQKVQVKLADGTILTGVLNMCGWNDLLHRFQITLGRQPIQLKEFGSWSNISLFQTKQLPVLS
jgi:hypothetical protein